MFGFDLMEIVAGLPGLIIAMALHEYAHARGGDGGFYPEAHRPAHAEPFGTS